MGDQSDDFQKEVNNQADPDVEDAVARHRSERPQDYDESYSYGGQSKSSRPPLTESTLRELRKKGGGGAGFTAGGTPINQNQLRSDADTRAFFRRAGRNQTQSQLDPYQVSNDAAALKEFYSPTQGALKGQRFDQPSEYFDTTLAASNEAWNAVPHRRGTMSERSIPHINPYDPDPFTKKPIGDTSTSDLDRQEKSLAWMADPKNNKGRTEFQQYESSPAETNPQAAYANKLANQKAYSSAMASKRIGEDNRIKAQSEIPATDYEKEAQDYQKANPIDPKLAASKTGAVDAVKSTSNPESHKNVDTLTQVSDAIKPIVKGIKSSLPPEVFDSFMANLKNGGLSAQNLIPIVKRFPLIGKYVKPLAVAMDVGKNAYETYNLLNNNDKLSTGEKFGIGAASALGSGLDILETLDPTGLLNFLPYFKMEKGLLKAITNATGVTNAGESMSQGLTRKALDAYGYTTPEEDAQNAKDQQMTNRVDSHLNKITQRQLAEGKIRLKAGMHPSFSESYERVR
jgi:hypothetical protein